jgi:hypothetical protein
MTLEQWVAAYERLKKLNEHSLRGKLGSETALRKAANASIRKEELAA